MNEKNLWNILLKLYTFGAWVTIKLIFFGKTFGRMVDIVSKSPSSTRIKLMQFY